MKASSGRYPWNFEPKIRMGNTRDPKAGGKSMLLIPPGICLEPGPPPAAAAILQRSALDRQEIPSVPEQNIPGSRRSQALEGYFSPGSARWDVTGTHPQGLQGSAIPSSLLQSQPAGKIHSWTSSCISITHLSCLTFPTKPFPGKHNQPRPGALKSQGEAAQEISDPTFLSTQEFPGIVQLLWEWLRLDPNPAAGDTDPSVRQE